MVLLLELPIAVSSLGVIMSLWMEEEFSNSLLQIPVYKHIIVRSMN
jgi:hypothetical protein